MALIYFPIHELVATESMLEMGEEWYMGHGVCKLKG